mmetsp:Transcript_15200/g.22757  ORF Transcript_15200/g.22757 Transcript_15200/m.22757 type:complete len:279 (-) Transcript_15200:63-899(-)|eukprot:CAMPEP_0201551842 /NCGR_PEP_ID=MMETSP0173_2-20130828/10946_1 /ASSEMBLY_ACC=CAM_ASM_000268 /TAXON_ID=218659 /ORGANISM="Vexillifera sp., Strain DIVA3 564/2" /LENGTH=278 /DNA_ID=CAMNT_0047962191 /DNA_START=45 /DNA_END=881 /DNA_ORIENTATION=+
MNANQVKSIFTKLAMIAGGLTGAGMVANNTLFVVPPGHRGLKYARFGSEAGVQKFEYDEGLHVYFPWFQNFHLIDIRTTPYVIRTDTGTKDLQTVRLSVRVLYAPKQGKLQKIFTGIGEDFSEKVFTSIGNEVLKAVVAQFDADELVTQRENVSQMIRTRLRERAKHYDLSLKDISITSLEFSAEYAYAIEAKQVEQQRAERQRYIVEREKQLKKANIIRIQGETEAARLISNAMKISPEFLELRRIETAKTVARILANARNVCYLPSGSNMLLNLSV